MQELHRFATFDVEVACRRPLSVCAAAAARYEHGRETAAYVSRVHFAGRVRYSDIHRLTRSDLRDAPPWAFVWQQLFPVLDSVPVVAYRAEFDRAALLTMCARHGVRLPPIQFMCAAALYRAHTGRHAPALASALGSLGLAFPGQPHEPLSDARAAAMLVHRLMGAAS